MIHNPSKPSLSIQSKTFALAVTIWLLLNTSAYANNVTVTNSKLTGQNTSGQYTMVQFDISWENSWRTASAPNNWDAAWVFVKYRIPVASGGDGLWKHAWLNDIGHTVPTGSTIDIGLLDPSTAFNSSANPGMGAFIYRGANGTGTYTATGIQLRWNYGSNGVSDNAIVDFQVYTIEMVYVPQGSFYVGSGGTEYNAFYKYPTTTNPYQILNESSIIVGTETDNLYYPNTNLYGGDRGSPIPAAFPKGYNAFYSMKYEITQQGYVDFLNSLTQTQANARKYTYAGERYAITGSAAGSYSTTNPYVACNYISFADVAAYLDWSGLRPMTELEYEKACRGPVSPVANEYAWGTTGIAGSAYSISNSGANNEVISTNYSTTLGNAAYSSTTPSGGSINGPVRAGIFAGSAGNNGRVTSGASYYGIMELSGNLYERAICVGSPQGRAFGGAHGNGVLDNAGNANVANWPLSFAFQRGGGWNNSYARISDRPYANSNYYLGDPHSGGRGVRSCAFTCGSSITINHTSGTVAPVTKTVTYGTVNNIPGETSKCWITSNLGADHQATAVNDATEASAGWYWQFNRKQGYKHDGTTRTPNSAWINPIDEDLNWEPANDPCTLELGGGWRIPTNTEWNNVNTSGSWTNSDGPWNSFLKLHPAGKLNLSDGLLYNRGTWGEYWSGTQSGTNFGWRLVFGTFCTVANSQKWYGFTLRCIKDQ
ncbi:MAG: hypothetical protein NTY96_08750 [Bacteroidetes bacterium]|nr:hypothetical protein [Bacteroidota bacterium]